MEKPEPSCLRLYGRSLGRLVNWGISAFSVDNCENMEDLKNQYGDKIAVVGNIDPVDLLAQRYDG